MANVTFAQCVVVDGVAYATVAAAQTAILTALLSPVFASESGLTPSTVVEAIMFKRDDVLAALTLKEIPKPKGRPKGSRNKTKSADLPGIHPKAA